jgi:hypothetical protein
VEVSKVGEVGVGIDEVVEVGEVGVVVAIDEVVEVGEVVGKVVVVL